VDNETFFYIRRTRAHPPRLASQAPRRATYTTALEQFEELLGAAEAASPGVRPLPLFYALSQAGRAIAAAGLPDAWKLRGHGLSCPDLSLPNVLDLEIEFRTKPKRESPDSFHGVAWATHGETPSTPVKLGALWMALPDACSLLEEADQIEQWPEALLVVVPETTASRLERFDRVTAGVVSRRHPDGASLVNVLDKYPYACETQIQEVPGAGVVATWTPAGDALTVHWPAETKDLAGRVSTLDRIVPTTPGGARWWRPLVAGVQMSDLTMWWALLFGLSMLARYEPAGWNAMLDLDSDPHAAHLVRLMDDAIEVLPALVLQVLEPSYVA